MKKNLYQMIKQAVTSIRTNDSGPYPRGQADYNGKTTEFLLLIPYGQISSPPAGSHAVLFSSQGQESVKVGIVSDYENKDGPVNEGEAGSRNALTGDFIKMNQAGNIEIQSVAGNIELDAIAGKMTVNSNVIELGSLAVQTLVNALFMTGVYDIHTHPQQGGGTTSPPNQTGIPGTHTTVELKGS